MTPIMVFFLFFGLLRMNSWKYVSFYTVVINCIELINELGGDLAIEMVEGYRFADRACRYILKDPGNSLAHIQLKRLMPT